MPIPSQFVRRALPLLALTLLPFSVQGAAPARASLAQFDQFVAREMAKEKIPGLSIGYLKDGVVWAKGYGYADLENRTPATAQSSYRLASVTKPMTATAILLLAEQGKLDLDAEVQTYVPYFPRKPFPITVRQLLGHLGGINAYVDSKAEQHFKEHKDTRQSIAVFENFDLVAEPGTRFRYTSYGYNLLGAVIEGVSGQSYGDFMATQVWRPLAMTTIRLDDPYDLIPNRVRGYQLIDKQIKLSEFVDISSRFSAGGTRGTVIDMLRFGDAISQGRMLSQESRARMFTSMSTRSGELTGYGMGWGVRPIDGKFAIAHDGVQPETSTYLFSFPSRKLTIAVAANLQRVDTSAFARALFESVTGEAWERKVYVRDQQQRPYHLAMQAIFNQGRAHFERTHSSYTDDAPTLNQAFASINKMANHPKGELQQVLVGSYIAQVLARKGTDLNKYSNSGSIAFISDYIALYNKDSTIAPEHRFDRAFERAVAALASHQTGTPLAPLDASDGMDALVASMKAAYGHAQVYPDHMAELTTLANDFLAKGQSASARQAARLAVEYYPDADAAHALVKSIEGAAL
ncbi:MAG: serine hydrolase domain-containing protein [Pseudomonadota bacterium]